MKILAQHGYGPKNKLKLGLEEGTLDGIIFSPRYWKPEKMRDEIPTYREIGGQLLMDPEYYATRFLSHLTPNLGSLEKWDYFNRPRKAQLITGTAIDGLIGKAYDQQISAGFSDLIAPNVYIDHADSVDTAISVNFINKAKQIAAERGDHKVYATLAFHRDALLDGREFRDILDGLTGLTSPPDGYYLIVGSNEQASTGRFIRSDLSQAEVIAGMMYANYVLSLNGFEVINGYSFLLSPLLGACGATAAASGWTSGLRKFCLGKYVKTSGGGSPPNTRYVCNPLMSHILQTDLENFRAVLPSVLNGLPSDAIYISGEPSRTQEGLQAWHALKAQADRTSAPGGDVSEQLVAFSEKIGQAIILWKQLQAKGFATESEQNIERLKAMKNGIVLFRELAEFPALPDEQV